MGRDSGGRTLSGSRLTRMKGSDSDSSRNKKSMVFDDSGDTDVGTSRGTPRAGWRIVKGIRGDAMELAFNVVRLRVPGRCMSKIGIGEESTFPRSRRFNQLKEERRSSETLRFRVTFIAQNCEKGVEFDCR